MRAREIDGTAGTLASNGALQISAQKAVLAQGQAQGRQVTLESPQLDTRNATVIATQGGALQVRNATQLDNRGGTLAAGGSLDIAATAVRNDGGTLSAGGTLDLRSDRVDNLAGTIAVTLNAGGRIEAAGLVQVAANGVDNRQGTLSAGQLSLDSRQQTFDNDGGTLDAGLDVRSGELRNSAGLIQAGGRLFIDTGSQALHNANSGSDKGIVGQDAVELRSGHLLNDRGFIAGKGNVLLVAPVLENRGEVVGERQVQVQGEQLDNQGGKMQARGDLQLTLRDALDNRDGLLRSAGQLSLHRPPRWTTAPRPSPTKASKRNPCCCAPTRWTTAKAPCAQIRPDLGVGGRRTAPGRP